MIQECPKCTELRRAVEDAERERVAVVDRFEAHATVADAEAAAKDYREARDALNRAIADLAVHRNAHQPSQDL